VKMASHNSFNGPINTSTSSSCSSSNTNNNNQKPILMRQHGTATYSESPQLSKVGGSEESGTMMFDDDLQNNTRSYTDLDLQCNLETPIISVSNSGNDAANYQLIPINRCRACKNCDKKLNTKPQLPSTPQLTRSQSKESIRAKILAQTNNPQQTEVAVCCCSAHCTHNCPASTTSPRAVNNVLLLPPGKPKKPFDQSIFCLAGVQGVQRRNRRNSRQLAQNQRRNSPVQVQPSSMYIPRHPIYVPIPIWHTAVLT
jgi:hypothetical protein